MCLKCTNLGVNALTRPHKVDIPERRIRGSPIAGLSSEVRVRASTSAARDFQCRPPQKLNILLNKDSWSPSGTINWRSGSIFWALSLLLILVSRWLIYYRNQDCADEWLLSRELMTAPRHLVSVRYAVPVEGPPFRPSFDMSRTGCTILRTHSRPV